MKSNFKEHYRTIDFPVFGYKIFIVYTNDLQRSRDTLNHRIGPDYLEKNVDGLHSYSKKHCDSFVFFTPKSSTGTIAHEISHALWQMFRYYGAKLENETFAYHLGYIIDIALDHKGKIDKKFKSFGHDQKAV